MEYSRLTYQTIKMAKTRRGKGTRHLQINVLGLLRHLESHSVVNHRNAKGLRALTPSFMALYRAVARPLFTWSKPESRGLLQELERGTR